jgi:hypothetical protein
MDSFPETTIRQFLLGQRRERQQQEGSLSEEMFFNDQLSGIVGSIEDEMIEEYLDGSMNALDQQSFEYFFLQPQERRKKLEFAQLLREHFDNLVIRNRCRLSDFPSRRTGLPHKSGQNKG